MNMSTSTMEDAVLEIINGDVMREMEKYESRDRETLIPLSQNDENHLKNNTKEERIGNPTPRTRLTLDSSDASLLPAHPHLNRNEGRLESLPGAYGVEGEFSNIPLGDIQQDSTDDDFDTPFLVNAHLVPDSNDIEEASTPAKVSVAHSTLVKAEPLSEKNEDIKELLKRRSVQMISLFLCFVIVGLIIVASYDDLGFQD